MKGEPEESSDDGGPPAVAYRLFVSYTGGTITCGVLLSINFMQLKPYTM